MMMVTATRMILLRLVQKAMSLLQMPVRVIVMDLNDV